MKPVSVDNVFVGYYVLNALAALHRLQNQLVSVEPLNALHEFSPNLPLNVKPRKIWLFLVDIRNINIRQTGSRIDLQHCSDRKL